MMSLLVWFHVAFSGGLPPEGVSLGGGVLPPDGRLPPSVDRQTPMKTLPSLAVFKNPRLPQSRIWNSGELQKVTFPLDMCLNIELYPRFLIFRPLLHRLLSPRAVLELSGRDSRRVRLPPCEKHRCRARQSHRQSLTLCQWWRTL